MPPRKKSRLEQWFSFSRHQRRFGASQLYDTLTDIDINELKSTIINGQDKIYTFGSAKNLHEHIDNLRHEFIGEPKINHYHATLIVLIRRDIDVVDNYEKFKALWLSEKDFLLKSLNTRWLISACDTFIDCDDDFGLRALLMNAVMLINTIKSYETERLLCQVNGTDLTENEHIKQTLQTKRVALFDGISAMAVGTDDTLRNMRWRLDKLCDEHELGQIVIDVFERLQLDSNNNIYSRAKNRHTRERTRWW